MADLLQIGAAWLEAQRKAHLSRTALYIRGGRELLVNVTLGKSDVELVDEYGVRVKSTTVDFIIAKDELLFIEGKDSPTPGDTIRLAHPDAVITYEVMALPGQDCWRYSDIDNQILRVHTRWLKAEAV